MCPDKDNQEIKSIPPTRHLVAEYDRKRKERTTFEKAYKRQTFFIRRDLIKKLNDLCNNRPGLKTQFVNSALEYCLNDLKGNWTKDVSLNSTNRVQSLPSGELMRMEAEQIIQDELLRSGLNERSKVVIASHVTSRLFEDNSDVTKLRNGERFQSPDVKQGRGKKHYDSAEACVKDLVNHWIKNSSSVPQLPEL